MRMKDYYPSNWLKAEDLDGKDVALTIKNVESKSFGDNEVKPLVTFEGTEKGLILNKTNFGTIAALYGDETDYWIGRKIKLYSTEVDFRGTTTLAIRIRLEKFSTAEAATARDTLLAAEPKAVEITDDDIPF